MSEHREPSESFPEVARLLSLKRHEVPPPGYFNHFSAKVIARIEAESLAEAHRPWWSAWLAPLGWQRSLAGANTLLVVGIGITGVAAYQSLQSTPEEENTRWAALKLPPSSASPADRQSDFATASSSGMDAPFHAVDSAMAASPRLGVRPGYPAGFAPVSFTTSAGESQSVSLPPSALFSTPTVQSLHGSQPRFVFPSE